MKNILARRAFTVSMADEDHVTECDYVGIVSGNDVPDKLTKAGFHTTKSEFVDAPLIDELPMALECRLISYDEKAGTYYILCQPFPRYSGQIKSCKIPRTIIRIPRTRTTAGDFILHCGRSIILFGLMTSGPPIMTHKMTKIISNISNSPFLLFI